MSETFKVWQVWDKGQGEYFQIKSGPMPKAEAERLCRLANAAEGMRAALGCYSECYDGCTCGDGWSHDAARNALAAAEAAKAKEERT